MPDAPLPPPRRSRRLLRRLALAAALLLLLACAALLAGRAALRSEAVRARVLAEVRPRLEERLGPVTLGPQVHLGWRGQVRLGPLEVAASRPGLPPVLRVEELGAALRLSALARGRLEVKRVELGGVQVEAGEDGRELRTLLQRLRGPKRDAHSKRPGAEAPPPTPRLTFEDVHLAGTHGGRRLALGPLGGHLQLTRDGDTQNIDAKLDLPGGGEAQVQLVRQGEHLPTGTVRVEDASLAALLSGVLEPAGPAAAEKVPPAEKPAANAKPALASGKAAPEEDAPAQAEAEAEAEADAEPAAGRGLQLQGGALNLSLELVEGGSVRFEGSVAELTVQHPRLAEGPVGPFKVQAQGQLALSVARRQVRLQELQLAVGERGEARVGLAGEADLSRAGSFDVRARVEELPYQAAVDALPEAFRPGPEAERLEGEFGAQLQLAGPVWQREGWRLTGKLDLSGLRRAAGGSGKNALALQGPFGYRPLTAEGRGRELRVGPENPDFVPLTEVPPLLVRAVLLSEDSFFFSHRGFDFESLGGNLFAPASEDGGVVRGGSTISQQLAKNLFLNREKTYARKVREAFLTLGLEASLSKARELEIYLNIIEWGPGLYGLGEAAHHYFGKDPRTLNVKEVAFLATIIPNPVRYHVYCARGALTEVWERRVGDLLQKMHDAGDLSDAQLAEAQGTQLHFTHGGARPPDAPVVPVFIPLPGAAAAPPPAGG
ncbi:glycosyl transferase [Aggregicoccus sp. 17bor-14]|uniref:biosynthetic peptidoglycan transglycosylase n=1 Tax=Myxococcaceae TaxID=31 RepID=UPI00129CB25C|nr:MULTISPECIES: biosynthetic peptidoglycan transglycosylase [Myxococcaceae]MBF5045884.1 transglycosylase domain-containing protein [Simulacricoccus sp. 17bor-14]MRI91618.1 glycosyl transferase [Aggregicoccus sp. 17bor-14]